MNRKIEFGPLYLPTTENCGPVDLAKKAEAWGYDYFWIPEYLTSPYLEPFVLAGAVAQATSKIRIGTAVALAPFRSPMQFAKSAASVDVLSGGRFTLGLGLGGMVRDFEVAQIDFRKRDRIMDETLDATRRLLAEENVSFEGRHHRFTDLTIAPRPVQSQLPIWVGAFGAGGVAERALNRAARYADGFFPAEISLAEFERTQSTIRERAASAGRNPDAIGWGLLTWFCLGKDVEDAHRTTSREISRRLGFDWSPLRENGYALGRPEDVIETIEGYARLGVTNFVIDPSCPPSEIVSQFEVFAKEIIPHFRSLGI